MSLRKAVLSSSTWTMLSFGLSQALRLGSNILLAALLFEEAFALLAIVTAIVQGLTMFSDVGLGPSVVQHKRGDDPEFLNTAWTIQVLRGTALTAIACIFSFPVAAFYATNDPLAWELRWLLPLAAIASLISGFNSTNLMTATRHMNIGRVTAIELTSQIVGLVAMVGTAWITRSVYSLVISGVVSAAIQCALSHVAVPGPRSRFCWDRTAVAAIIGFGKWVFVSTILSFLSLQIDRLVFAKLFPLEQVGVYAIAASLAALIPTLLGRVQIMVAFPLYARILDRGARLSEVFNDSKPIMLIVGGYLTALAIAGADSFVALCYDTRYAAAATYIPILAGAAWFVAAEGVYGAAFLAMGRAQWVALGNATKVVAFCALLLPATHYGGLIGAAFAVVAADVTRYLVSIALGRTIDLRKQAPDLALAAYATTTGLVVVWLTPRIPVLRDAADLVKLAAQGCLVTLAYAPALLFAARTLHHRTR